MMPTKLNTLEHRRHGDRAMRSVASFKESQLGAFYP